jgi:hypothetical protein
MPEIGIRQKSFKSNILAYCVDLTVKGTTGANIIKLFTVVSYELS